MDKFIKKLKRWLGMAIIEDIDDGLIIADPDFENDWSFGSKQAIMGAAILKPNGRWLDVLPDEERQRKRVETQGCVSWSALNILELLAKARYGQTINRSDRFTAKMSGTGRRGNTYMNVANSIRKDGTVKEESWPFGNNLDWESFYKSVPREVILQGQSWLNKYKVNHEWVRFSVNNFKEALRYAPLQIGVMAWAERKGKYFFPQGARYTHATTLVGYKEGEYWLVFDSYFPFVKKLEWNYPLYKYALKYNIEKLKSDSPGAKLYERFAGKFIILPDLPYHGEVYYISSPSEGSFLQKVPFAIGHPKLFKKVHTILQREKAFTGLSAANWTLLKNYVLNELSGTEKEPLGSTMNETLLKQLYAGNRNEKTI